MADVRDPHDDHDPLVIATLVDRPAPAADRRRSADAADDPEIDAMRAVATSWVGTCRSCAALLADLASLAQATRDTPSAARTRDFRLTAPDAARLVAGPTSGEPVAAPARLSGVMIDPRPASAAHATHDTLLVASLADHSLALAERSAAQALVASCDSCAAIHADLTALRDATRMLPTPSRPRDYTLTAADAARLRPAGWRRLVAAFGTTRDAFSRPLAVGLTTLGIAGLLVATLPSMLPSAGSAALSTVGSAVGQPGANQEAATDANGSPMAAASSGNYVGPGAIPSAAGSAPPGGSDVAAPIASSEKGVEPVPVFGPIQTGHPPLPTSLADGDTSGATKSASHAPDQTADQSIRLEQLAASTNGPSALVVLSGAILLVGLVLFAVRWGSRRRRAD